MSDYGTMIARIESEVHRTNENAAVRSAVLSAIEHYEDTEPPFHVTTERSESATIDGQTYYELPTDFVDFIGEYPLQITVNQSTYPLNRRSWDYLQIIDLNAVVGKGIPFDWAYGDNQIRLYPQPQAAHGLCLYYRKSLPVITADTDSNFWTTRGERLIRARAKWDLYTNVIHQADKADRMRMQELEAERILRGIETRRSSTGRVMPQYL